MVIRFIHFFVQISLFSLLTTSSCEKQTACACYCCYTHPRACRPSEKGVQEFPYALPGRQVHGCVWRKGSPDRGGQRRMPFLKKLMKFSWSC